MLKNKLRILWCKLLKERWLAMMMPLEVNIQISSPVKASASSPRGPQVHMEAAVKVCADPLVQHGPPNLHH